jgi:nicotinate-nucleotide adenylyltransferase
MGMTPSAALVRPGSVGVMGGTFDPIHVGHLAVAEEAREVLGLERILFVPAGLPPHKPEGAEASIDDRVAMVIAAIEDNPAFELSRVDIDRDGPSYTVDTMAILAAQAVREGRVADLTLIMSSETLAGLPSWREPELLLATCRIAVVPREGHESPDPAWLQAEFPGLEDRFDRLDGPRLGISSTAIRERVRAGRSIRYLVPQAVEGHIADHHLYTDDPNAGPARP